MKTSELTGAALDWAVAKAEGYTGVALESRTGEWYTPSSDWAQGGPIIEREEITIICWTNPGQWGARLWPELTGRESIVLQRGPTPLIAAMRCYVASKLGDTVDIPEELL
jgi:hypothetical protein